MKHYIIPGDDRDYTDTIKFQKKKQKWIEEGLKKDTIEELTELYHSFDVWGNDKGTNYFNTDIAYDVSELGYEHCVRQERVQIMTKGFNKKEFMSWLKSEFPGSVDNHWNYDLVENIIDYALAHESISKDQFCYFVSDMLPEVEFLEVARFCENGKLTNRTLEALGR